MAKFDLRSSVGARMVIVGLLTILLVIPAFMIRALVFERQERRDEVAAEISRNWGAEQVLIGPMVTVPYQHKGYDEKKNIVESTRYLYIMPESLHVSGQVNPDLRNRGIYQIVVYNCDLDISGSFNLSEIGPLSVEPESVRWSEATLAYGISDVKGLKEPIEIVWNGQILDAEPGLATKVVISSGVSVPVDLSLAQEYTFDTHINLNGSTGLYFSPVGEATSVRLSSGWPNPSFAGDYLPSERKVTDSGFESEWKILQVSRDFPQMWGGNRYDPSKTLFGVNLLMAVDPYQKTMRTVKYAIMFICLTFLTFFVMEILGGKPIHPMQYLFIGLALMIFYTLLLSLSEYIAFNLAYLIASGAIIALITIYSTSFLSSKRGSLIVALVLSVLYGYMFVVLQMQDYALLMGSLILLIALALVMYLTRRIDWFSVLNYRKTPD